MHLIPSYKSQGVETIGASLGKGGTYALLFAQRRFHAPIRALRILAPLLGSHKYHLFQVSLTCNELHVTIHALSKTCVIAASEPQSPAGLR